MSLRSEMSKNLREPDVRAEKKMPKSSHRAQMKSSLRTRRAWIQDEPAERDVEEHARSRMNRKAC